MELDVQLIGASKEPKLMGTTAGIFSDTQEPILHGRQEETRQLTNVIAAHQPSLTRIALRLVGNAADAEDAVQDAFLSAYTHLDQFKGQAQMSTWLTTIVINAARMKVRRRPRQVHIPLDQENREQGHRPLSEMLSDRRPSPEELCRTGELAERLTQVSTQLSPTLRGAFQLREVDGLSIRETAQALGIPHGTVKARVARARRKLKQLLQVQANNPLQSPFRGPSVQEPQWRSTYH
jgi:RNA polymerase sigma-70 factor (ECF subfamily)